MPDDRGAVLQFEVDRKRWNGVYGEDISANTCGETLVHRMKHIARTAVNDTLRHGGTFVLVVSAEKITMVQRPDAEKI